MVRSSFFSLVDPTWEWWLDGNADDITVARVEKDGPAERAGIRAGDKVLAVDGIKIRSVYQATPVRLCPSNQVTK